MNAVTHHVQFPKCEKHQFPGNKENETNLTMLESMDFEIRSRPNDPSDPDKHLKRPWAGMRSSGKKILYATSPKYHSAHFNLESKTESQPATFTFPVARFGKDMGCKEFWRHARDKLCIQIPSSPAEKLELISRMKNWIDENCKNINRE